MSLEEHMPFMTQSQQLGRQEGLLKGIEVLLEVKFGVSGLNLLPEIRALHDEEMFEAVLEAMKTATGPDELRCVWAP